MIRTLLRSVPRNRTSDRGCRGCASVHGMVHALLSDEGRVPTGKDGLASSRRRASSIGEHRRTERDPMFIHGQAVHSRKAKLAIEAVSCDEYEPCRRVLEARAAEWVRSGRSPSRLLEADELRVVRRWLRDGYARGPGASDEIQRLVASSEATLAALVATAAAADARHRRRLRRWVTGALVVLIVAAVGVSTAAVIVHQWSRDPRRLIAEVGDLGRSLPRFRDFGHRLSWHLEITDVQGGMLAAEQIARENIMTTFVAMTVPLSNVPRASS